ncbi:hypothetical protein [Piscinibacter sp. HJYY11]|uniref:hypothetical protein n=1 Tax=Piscinibacter sp. HJYY11 TaxID=2801333 RepID=UPI00191ED02B|nr:hypothetical protein [Piscinibacter sp. HJYY11]MBL0727647.1 hypothetical protein [Piscinibacter sp. HJYY11]
MRRLAAATLSACALAYVHAVHAAPDKPLLWADFKEPMQSHLGAPVQQLAMSERSGDASIASVRVADAVVQVEGRLSTANASQWATLGIEVGGDARGVPVDLSAYEHLRIRLASTTPRVLRIRLKGTDPRIQNAGCYPVMMMRVGTQLSDYLIPLSAFGPESFCGERGATIAQTLPAVARVEVTANEPSVEPVRFQVGRMEFMAAPAAEPAPAAAPAPAPVVAAAASTPPTPRATPPAAARKPSPPAPASRAVQVVCERNPRYGLMMCH